MEIKIAEMWAIIDEVETDGKHEDYTSVNIFAVSNERVMECGKHNSRCWVVAQIKRIDKPPEYT